MRAYYRAKPWKWATSRANRYKYRGKTIRLSCLDLKETDGRQFVADIAPYAQWHIEDETAQLAFTSTDGRVQTYALTAVATYIPSAQDFAWAWANSAFTRAVVALTPRLRDLYDVTQYGIFHTPSFIATPRELDTLCALALWHL